MEALWSPAPIEYNIYWENVTTATGGSLPAAFGNIVTVNANSDSCDIDYNLFMDPLYADTANSDFHLTVGSPCIDAGNPTSPYDPDGTIADMGAFYFDQTKLHANLIADIISGSAPLTVNFTDLSTGSPTSWQWDFENDGTVDLTGQNPVWIYQLSGIYSVKLIVSDGTDTDTIIKTDYITVTPNTSYALNFDGLDDYVKSGGFPFPADDLTIEAWINPDNLVGNHEVVFFFNDISGI